MNDRFKFRFFETYNNTMLDCKDYDFEEILESGKPVMQCTGMKDKNGKLIYEGDFLKDDENLLYEVIFKLQKYATSFSLKRREIPDYYPHITTWCGLGYRNCNKYEVVGNIYENEELLDEHEK